MWHALTAVSGAHWAWGTAALLISLILTNMMVLWMKRKQFERVQQKSKLLAQGGDDETGSPETVPPAYRGPKSKLEATVSSGGENVFNFDLKSDGS